MRRAWISYFCRLFPSCESCFADTPNLYFLNFFPVPPFSVSTPVVALRGWFGFNIFLGGMLAHAVGPAATP
jgi:hypothetical protein